MIQSSTQNINLKQTPKPFQISTISLTENGKEGAHMLDLGALKFRYDFFKFYFGFRHFVLCSVCFVCFYLITD